MPTVRARSFAILAAVLVWLGGSASQPPEVNAQTADPVGLIASAAIVPFWAGATQFTVFEVTSLGFNQDMHAFFFDANCNRVFSVPFRMTEHDADVVFSGELGLNFNGLMVLAKSVDNISPEALDSPITLRGHRVDLLQNSIAAIDPISARNAEDPTRTWNPLRSGASTITFPGVGTTRWFFVCPRNNVTVDLGGGIPPLPPGANLVRMRVYNLEEDPLLDIQVPCNCFTEVNPATLHPIFFGDARYVEMVATLGLVPVENPPSFVLYRQLRFGGLEDFGRAPGMSAPTLLTGEPVVGAR